MGGTSHSWGYSGVRGYTTTEPDGPRANNSASVVISNGLSIPWGMSWTPGDIIGAYINFETRCVMFSLNGVWQDPCGLAFSDMDITKGAYPVVTFESNFQFRLNLGKT